MKTIPPKYDPYDPGNWRDGDDACGNARAQPPVADGHAEQGTPIYQCRDSIRSDAWKDCSKDAHDHMAKYPACFEVRIVYAAPQPSQPSAVVLDDERAALTPNQFAAIRAGAAALQKIGGYAVFGPVLQAMLDKARAASPQATAAQAEAEVSEERGLTDEQIREHFDTHAIYALEGKKLYWNEALSFAHAILTAAHPANGDKA